MDPIFWFAVFLIGCLVAILVWVWKHVTPPPPPPTLTLTTSVASVESGNPITFAGTLMQGSTPLASKTVALAVTPPSGDGYSLSNGHMDGGSSVFGCDGCEQDLHTDRSSRWQK
jgi:hypothetical protein